MNKYDKRSSIINEMIKLHYYTSKISDRGEAVIENYLV